MLRRAGNSDPLPPSNTTDKTSPPTDPPEKNTNMESPDPFTPGFGEFQGIPDRTLPDDCMGYAIFALALDSADVRTRLEEVKLEAEEMAAAWSDGYIWQREGFSLELVEKTQEKTWCLQGRTEYGDSVDDEWFIVWMLRELSKGFTDLWIRCGLFMFPRRREFMNSFLI